MIDIRDTTVRQGHDYQGHDCQGHDCHTRM